MKSMSSLDKQIVAFEIMSQPLSEIKFAESFFDNLIDELSIPKSPQAFVKGLESQSSILPIRILRELSSKIRKRSNLTEGDKTLHSKLTEFLKQFQFAKSLKKYFDEKVYTSMYLSCFDPVEFVVLSSDQICDDSGAVDCFFLTEINSSDRLSELMKTENKRKVVQITKDLFDLHLRWNKVVDEDNTDLSVFEKETTVTLRNDTSRFKMCKIIFGDLNLKTKKSVTLLNEWMTYFRKWCNQNQCPRNIENFNHDLVERVNSIKKSITKLDDYVKSLENVIMHITKDNQCLETKENSLIKYVNRKEDLVNLRDKVNVEYDSLLVSRTELIGALSGAINGTLKYEKLSREICSIEDSITKKFMELKSLNYTVVLAQQDSQEMATSLKDFVRWLDSGNQTLKDKEVELHSKMEEKQKFEAFLEEVYQNIYRIKSVVGLKIAQFPSLMDNNSGVMLRPFTSNTYTIEENNVRFKDMNVTQGE